MSSLPAPPIPPAEGGAAEPTQRVIKLRRDYNTWVAHETMEDYALRFTPRSFRKWSLGRVANTALGGAASFLVLEAVGATLLVQHGFVNAALAILATGLVILLAGWPISVYAARHGVDMDLLTRGAGFGYIGSTLTSLIYASFTFIFFALEAAVMAYALELAFGIPPAWGYLICALAVIPLVTHGVTAISRLQVWTQPLWLAMLVAPYVYVFAENPGVLDQLMAYGGEAKVTGFSWLHFGAATTVGVALITQMGEQADYLRFMPEPEPERRGRWWLAVLVGGPGWVLPGVLKMLGGCLLAFLAIKHMVPLDRAVDPNQMYLAAYELVFSNAALAVAATALFVVISQLKINVTNAYAGSLAWSNFFARLTHSHPGRVVWVVFNTTIALLLMELDVFQAIGAVLGLYSNVAIAWMMAVVADLVINKPMGWSPRGIEFRRAHLYDVNPVGVGAMLIATTLGVAAHLGVFGPMAQAWSAAIAMVTAFVASPLIAWATKGRYYLARQPDAVEAGPYKRLSACCICERAYEADDIASCPAYGGPICSLCCTLDARCNDLCKPPKARLAEQWSGLLRKLLPRASWPYLDTGLGHYLLLMLALVPLLVGVFALLYQQELRMLAASPPVLPVTPITDESTAASQTSALSTLVADALKTGFVKAFAALLLLAGTVAWWLVLAHKSRQVAQEESNRQTQALQAQTAALQREIASHRRTDLQLQLAKQQADQAKDEAERARLQADRANAAKSRYITAISHELRTPLNSILGYAQLLEEDASMPPARAQAVRTIRRGGDHLASLIEDSLDLARIEGGKLTLEPRPLRLTEAITEIARLFELQAQAKGLVFRHEIEGPEKNSKSAVPALVRADERRLRQILINLLGNAVKFTARGEVVFRMRYAREIARFEIEDSGPGMSNEELARVFEPFERGSVAGDAGTGAPGGTGLGLTIAKMLTELMGGEMTVRSTPGQGTAFAIRLFLPQMTMSPAEAAALSNTERGAAPKRSGYRGARRSVLVVDNEEADRGLVASVLEPRGFMVRQAASGEAALALLRSGAPVDAILMDLAMPGLDGWATVRRLRAEGLSEAPVAIVSANAFDRGLDNDVGVSPADFFVKPVRVAELLEWLGRVLALDWLDEAAVPRTAKGAVLVTDASPTAAHWPEALPPAAFRARAAAIAEAARLGYLRGVLDELAEAEAEDAAATAWTEPLRQQAQRFAFDALRERLAGIEAEAPRAPGAVEQPHG
jgi:signal transduction histidine kinase/CheY-like chemotaxis protein/purine-cytosine permease-like protein